MIKSFEEMTEAHKNAFDALIQLQAVLAQGFREINEHVSSLAKQTIDMHIATGKAVSEVRTPQDLSNLHSQWASHSFESSLNSALKLADISTKISTRAAAPLQTHLTETWGKMANALFPAKAA